MRPLGRVQIEARRPADAERHLREAYQIARQAFPRDNWRPAEAQILLGVALAAQHRADQSRLAFAAGLREMTAVLPASHPRVQEARRLASADLPAKDSR